MKRTASDEVRLARLNELSKEALSELVLVLEKKLHSVSFDINTFLMDIDYRTDLISQKEGYRDIL